MLMKGIKIFHMNVLQSDTSVSYKLVFGILSKFMSVFTNFASFEQYFNLKMYKTKSNKLDISFKSI